MKYSFKYKDVELLYTQEKDAHKYPKGVVDAFFECMTIIDNARDIRDIYAFKSLHFEKLSGDRKGQHSIRLNKQFRLTLSVEEDAEGQSLLIIRIEDYHK